MSRFSKNQVRTQRVLIDVSAEEKASLRLAAAAHGLPVARFIRQAALGRAMVRAEARTERRDLIGQLGRIGNNLNQLAHWSNQSQSPADSRALAVALADLRQVARAIVDEGM